MVDNIFIILYNVFYYDAQLHYDAKPRYDAQLRAGNKSCAAGIYNAKCVRHILFLFINV